MTEMDIEEKPDLRDTETVTKYKTASDIANRVLGAVINMIKAGVDVYDVCVAGDNMIVKETSNVYVKGNISKGIGFPTCISINNCVSNYSPLKGESVVIKNGDVCKIVLGVAIDGFCVQAGHTVIATETGEKPAEPIKGNLADAVCAAHFAAEASLRLLRPGRTSDEIQNIVNKIADIFKVKHVMGVSSHRIEKESIENKDFTIVPSFSDEQKDRLPPKFGFEEFQAYTLDICMTTGEGVPKEKETRTTVYCRNQDELYSLKSNASRSVYNEIKNKFPFFPFSLRNVEDKKARLGIKEIVEHNLVSQWSCQYDSQGSAVVQFMYTVLILPSGTQKLTEFFPLPFVSSEYQIEDKQVKEILDMGLKRKKKNKKKKKKSAAGGGGGDAMDVE